MAALNFPGSPSNGDEFEGYIYDATLGVWNRKPNTVAYTVSPAAPTNPNDGDVWFNETDGSSYIYYVDADSEQWVEIGGTVGATGARGENGSDGRFTNSATKPSEPVDGDVWFNTNTGQIFVYYDDGTTSQWVESGTKVLAYDTLANLSDTNIPSPSDGQALVYDNATSKWIPGDVSVDIYDTANSSTGFFSVPKGDNSQRPQNPVNGDMRFNTETEEPEWYSETAGQWIKFRLSPSQEFEYLVIAGGGGAGGYYSGGGGGAGGYRSSVDGQLSGGLSPAETKLSFAAGDVFTVQVGAGGNGGAGSGTSEQMTGSKGSNSILDSVVSIGGGGAPTGGYSAPSLVKDGGSGAGASGNVPNNIGGLGTLGQGFNGGNANTAAGENYAPAGGGGAGEAGADAASYAPGKGGDGIFSNITGTSIQRGGGGGAGAHNATSGAPGGAGGGGAGGLDGGNNSGFSGASNTGGGGGGGHYESNTGALGGNGGSGIVIVRYPASFNLTIGGGLTSTTTVVGDKKVTQFTAGTDQVTVG